MPIPTLDLAKVNVHKPQAIGTPRKLLTHHDGDDYILEMDWTSINTFLTCPQAAYNALILGRVEGKSAALTAGAAIHSGLETYYRGERDLGKILAACIPEFEANPPPLGEWRNMPTVHNALEKYIAHWQPLDSFEIKKNGDELMVEQAFSTPLCEILVDKELKVAPWQLLPFDQCEKLGIERDETMYIRKIYVQWTGVLDLGLLDAGQNTVMDHKTTSIGGPTYYDQFDMSQQLRGYCWAMGKISGEPTNRAIANVIEWRAPTVKGKGNPLDFQRKFVVYSPDSLARWETDMSQIIKNLVECLVVNAFPENTHSCVGKFGRCSYLDVCRLDKSLRPTLINSDTYTTNVWNPLA